MSKTTKIITVGDQLKQKLRIGSALVATVAETGYGKNAKNCLIEVKGGYPLLSHDGVSNIKRIEAKDPVVDLAVKTIRQASERTNTVAGDGTTATVLLSDYLFRNKTVAEIKQLQKKAVEAVEKAKRPASEKDLVQIGIVATGERGLGELIADTSNKVGKNGGVIALDSQETDISNEIIEGIFMKQGFVNVNLINDPANLRSNYTDTYILLSDRTLTTFADIAPYIEIVCGEHKEDRLVIVADVTSEALETVISTKLSTGKDICIVKPEGFGGARTLFIEDLATATGGKKIPVNPEEFKMEEHLGLAKKITVTERSTTIIGGEATDEAKNTIKTLEKALKDAKDAYEKEVISERLNILNGKVGILRVGGATQTEQKERRLRVDDAICAIESARKEGVVKGGGSSIYAEIPFLTETLANRDKKPISEFLEQVEEENILDPALVVKETINNASSVAISLLNTEVAITYEERS